MVDQRALVHLLVSNPPSLSANIPTAAYNSLISNCATISSPAASSTVPKPSLGADSTATAQRIEIVTATTAPSPPAVSPFAGVANTEDVHKSSVAALVAVIAVALAIL